MMVVVATFEAQPGKEQEVEEILKAAVPNTQAEEGTLVYNLHRAQGNPCKFMFYEKYADEAAFAVHGAAPYLAELITKVVPLITGEPVIELYEELAAKT